MKKEKDFSEAEKGKGRRVLVVDNSPVILRFMEHLLEKNGHQVATANDGVTALEVLKNFKPEICFIDLIMENISGDKLCRVLRSTPEFKDVFLVILSAVAAEEENPFAKYAADAFVAKGPFKQVSDNILRIIEVLDTGEIQTVKGIVLGKEHLHARQVTRELLNSKEHYEIALNHMAEGFLELLDDKIIYVNPAAVAIVGGSEESLLNTNFQGLFKKADEHTVAALLASAKIGEKTVELSSPLVVNDKLVLIKIVPVAEKTFQSILVILRDVSRQKALESKLLNAQKMEAIGTLAGGVAHDLNNVLSGIVSYPDLLLMQLPEDSPLKKPIETIKKSGEKAATIVQDLLTLARRGMMEKNTLNLNQVVNDYLASPEYALMQSHHPEVEVETDLLAGLLNCSGSPIHLSNMIMNLVSNGVEAIAGHGKVRVVTENIRIDVENQDAKGLEEGEYIRLTVCDNGAGIQEHDMERIFEPFYTKKKMGRSGTGLGMTVVWGTVKDHDGHIDVASVPGEGTSLSVYLPAIEKDVVRKDRAIFPNELKGNGESVLIIDDVKDQHDIATQILKGIGYVPYSAFSGEQALEFLAENNVDLVLLDMIMDPGIDGYETYKRIAKLNPSQKVILVSGYSQTDRIRAALKLGAGRYVQKPYTIEHIARAIKEELQVS